MKADQAFSGYIEYSRKRFRAILADNVFINRNTPVGDPEEYRERKPYGGRREFRPIFEVVDGQICHCFKAGYSWGRKRWEYVVSSELVAFLEDKKISIPEECGFTRTHLILMNEPMVGQKNESEKSE